VISLVEMAREDGYLLRETDDLCHCLIRYISVTLGPSFKRDCLRAAGEGLMYAEQCALGNVISIEYT
jgi:hypothetical protein